MYRVVGKEVLDFYKKRQFNVDPWRVHDIIIRDIHQTLEIRGILKEVIFHGVVTSHKVYLQQIMNAVSYRATIAFSTIEGNNYSVYVTGNIPNQKNYKSERVRRAPSED